jgi:hypothetical protein
LGISIKANPAFIAICGILIAPKPAGFPFNQGYKTNCIDFLKKITSTLHPFIKTQKTKNNPASQQNIIYRNITFVQIICQTKTDQTD